MPLNGPSTEEDVAATVALLTDGDLSVVGQVTTASNVAILGEVLPPHGAAGGGSAGGGSAGGGTAVHVIYKPVQGERPLWDFPTGTLAGREWATFLVSREGGWPVIPPTVLREGPLGAGSVQLWIGDPFAPQEHGTPVVDIVPAGTRPGGWCSVIDGELASGRRVSVVHENLPDVRGMAVLDAVTNNSDRKGSHLVRDASGRLWGFDHGVSFHVEPKLRTVLWGWAGQPLAPADLERLARLENALADADSSLCENLRAALPRKDVEALTARVRRLLARRVHPDPMPGWPSIPWPAI